MTRRLVVPVTILIGILIGLAIAGCSVLRMGQDNKSTGVVQEVQPAAPDTGADELPRYVPVSGLSGQITGIGASTTTNLVARSAIVFRRMYPNVAVLATAGQTSIGAPALLEGKVDIVPMSRALTVDEVEAFHQKYGYPPTEIKVAADALAVYVEKTNPVAGLTLVQLRQMFGQVPPRGLGSIETWGQVGGTGEWAARGIDLYGYGPEDAVSEIFRARVLDGGQYRLSMMMEPAGSSIVQGVAADPQAIGCASIFFAARRVRTVPLAGADGQFYGPTPQNVRSQKYPLSRFLSVYVNKPPHAPLGRATREFPRFLLSREGQQLVADEGGIPLDAATALQGRRALD